MGKHNLLCGLTVKCKCGLKQVEIQSIKRIKKLGKASMYNYERWITSNVDLIVDHYPQQLRINDVVKLDPNNFFVNNLSIIVVELANMGYPGHRLYFLVLDGPAMLTSTLLANKLNTVPNSNILVPNFTNAYVNMYTGPCTPLFMPVGPVVTAEYQSQFPKNVKLHNLAMVIESMPLMLAGIWLDYCDGATNVIEDLQQIIPRLTFASLCLFGVTICRHGGKYSSERFERVVSNILLYNHNKKHRYFGLTFVKKFESPQILTLFWRIVTYVGDT